MSDNLVDRLNECPEAVKQCAKGAKTWYVKGGCDLTGEQECPYQSQRKLRVDDRVLSACAKYHPKLKKA